MSPVEMLLTDTMAERSLSRAAASQWLATHRPVVLEDAFIAERAAHMALLKQVGEQRA